jgi:hypothetical protein
MLAVQCGGDNPGDGRQGAACSIAHKLLGRHDKFPVGSIPNMLDGVEGRPDVATRPRWGSVVAPAIMLGVQFVGQRLKVEARFLKGNPTAAILDFDRLIGNIAAPAPRYVFIDRRVIDHTT